MADNNSKNYIQTVGRRKTSSARVRLYKGAGDHMVNDMPISEYFPGEVMEATYLAPLELTDTANEFHVTAKVVGGGVSSQAQAVAHGIARALVKQDSNLKKALKDAGLTKRDPRMKERRKPGNAQAARAKKSSPKR